MPLQDQAFKFEAWCEGLRLKISTCKAVLFKYSSLKLYIILFSLKNHF